MNQPLIEREDPTSVAAATLRRMADRLDLNKGAKIGGLAVIIPPENGGEPIEVLILDAAGDIAQFYSTVQSRIQIRLADLQDKARMQQGFGMR